MIKELYVKRLTIELYNYMMHNNLYNDFYSLNCFENEIDMRNQL